jgi:dTDP-4-amino-4,6-dideoxygalactose transaminase
MSSNDLSAKDAATVTRMSVVKQGRIYPGLDIDIPLIDYARICGWTAMGTRANNDALRRDIQKAWVPANPDSVVISLSIRTFMHTLLTALKLPRGSEVVMSGITIPNVVTILEEYGLVCKAYDLDLVTFTADIEQARALVTGKTKLLIVTPVVGRPITNMLELRQLAAEKGVMCYIDAAQCFTFREKVLAMDADISSVSFGSIKFSTALSGALSVVKDPLLAAAIRDVDRTHTPLTTSMQVKVNLKQGLLLLVDDPVSYGILRLIGSMFGYRLRDILDLVRRAGFSGQQLLRSLEFSPHTATFKLLLHRLQTVDRGIARRRSQNAWDMMARLPAYVQAVSGGNPEAPERSTFWLMCWFVKDTQRCCDVMQAQGFDATAGVSEMRAVPGDVPNCRAFMQHILYVPCYQAMNEVNRKRFLRMVFEMPESIVGSPHQPFHDYVAGRAEKHAYRGAAVDKFIADRPQGQDYTSVLLSMLGMAPLAFVLSKL